MEKNGYCATYFKNGEIESETYYEDNNEGSYKKYNENGLLLERGHLKKEKQKGIGITIILMGQGLLAHEKWCASWRLARI